jgi:carbon monoxide dehydrogenase subunit G
MKNPAAVALGSLGGKVKSETKAKTSAANGAKGGRPKIIRFAGGRIEYAYKFALIEREENGTRLNWACHIDGARRNFGTLKAAKLHVDNVEAGIDHQGLR